MHDTGLGMVWGGENIQNLVASEFLGEAAFISKNTFHAPSFDLVMSRSSCGRDYATARRE
jgi:hypothetical protein